MSVEIYYLPPPNFSICITVIPRFFSSCITLAITDYYEHLDVNINAGNMANSYSIGS